MGALGLAGAISGMGQGVERGLQQMQSGFIQQGLQDADRQFQSEKLKLQMEHAERLQQASIGAAAGENAKNRELQTTLHSQTEAGATARQQQSIGAQLTGSAIQADATKEAAKATIASHEKISQLANDTQKEIHKATNDVSKYVADTNRQNALLKSYSDAQDALKTEINRLDIIVTDFKADPNSSAYKSALKELEQRRRESLTLSQSRDALQQKIEKETGVERPAPPQPKKFVLPDMGGSPAPSAVPQSRVAPSPQSGLANSLTPGKTMEELYGK